MKKKLAVLAAAAAMGALFSPAVAAHAATHATPGQLSGTINGANAVEVDVFAWPAPNGDDQEHLGQASGRQLIASTMSSGGAYSITPDLSTVGAPFKLMSGGVNVEVDVEGMTWMTTLDGVTPQTANFDTTNGDVAANGDAPTPSGSPGVYGPTWSCSDWQEVGWDVPGESFTYAYGVAGATVDVDEEIGASHSVGAALAVDKGGFSANGSVTMEAHTAGGNTKQFAAPKIVRNQVNYKEMYKQCTTPPNGKEYYRWMADSFHYLESGTFQAVYPHYSTCTYQSSGAPWKSQGTNHTFDGGVNLSALSVFSHSAYSQDMKSQWHITSPNYMCGSDYHGFTSAPVGSAQTNVG